MTTPSSSASSTAASTGAPDARVVAAWQAALAAEHAAVFGYGGVGPRLPDAERGLAAADQLAHVVLRDATIQALKAAGVDPVRALTSYPGPGVVAGAPGARRSALGLEEACARAWRYLVSVAADHADATSVRAAAVTALTASAVRAVRWRARVDPARPSVPFPGI